MACFHGVEKKYEKLGLLYTTSHLAFIYGAGLSAGQENLAAELLKCADLLKRGSFYYQSHLVQSLYW